MNVFAHEGEPGGGPNHMSFLNDRGRSAPQGFGRPVRRQEDARLLTGQGCFSDDFTLPRQVYARFVRSPHAHARIRRIDVAASQEVTGVIAVLTGRDAAADGLAPIPHRPVPTNPHEFPLAGRGGSDIFVAPHPTLSRRYGALRGRAGRDGDRRDRGIRRATAPSASWWSTSRCPR